MGDHLCSTFTRTTEIGGPNHRVGHTNLLDTWQDNNFNQKAFYTKPKGLPALINQSIKDLKINAQSFTFLETILKKLSNGYYIQDINEDVNLKHMKIFLKLC